MYVIHKSFLKKPEGPTLGIVLCNIPIFSNIAILSKYQFDIIMISEYRYIMNCYISHKSSRKVNVYTKVCYYFCLCAIPHDSSCYKHVTCNMCNICDCLNENHTSVFYNICTKLRSTKLKIVALIEGISLYHC